MFMKVEASVVAKAIALLLVVGLEVISSGVLAQPLADEVKSLPGVLPGPLSSREYSGYLQASGTIKLHYW